MNMKIRIVGAILVLAVWAGLAGFAWFGAPQEFSEAERRPLEQMPEVSSEQIFGGKFMTEFESYTLDQFPLRDRFRQIKSLFHSKEAILLYDNAVTGGNAIGNN